MKRSPLLATVVLASVAVAQPSHAQNNIYEWSAAINLGLGLLNQMIGVYHQLHPYPYGYGVPYGGQGFGTFGPPGWHLRGQSPVWGQLCQGQLMQDQIGRRAIVDSCTGQVLLWVR